MMELLDRFFFIETEKIDTAKVESFESAVELADL